jgi:hypothetical protein
VALNGDDKVSAAVKGNRVSRRNQEGVNGTIVQEGKGGNGWLTLWGLRYLRPLNVFKKLIGL